MKSNHAYGSFSANFVTHSERAHWICAAAIYDYECRCRSAKAQRQSFILLMQSSSLCRLQMKIFGQQQPNENERRGHRDDFKNYDLVYFWPLSRSHIVGEQTEFFISSHRNVPFHSMYCKHIVPFSFRCSSNKSSALFLAQ